MAFEVYQPLLLVLIDVFSALSAVYALLFLWKVKKRKQGGEAKIILARVFASIGIAYILFAIAEVSWSILSIAAGQEIIIGFPDYFWIAGIIFFLFGYYYFAFYMHKKHGEVLEGSLIMGLTAVITTVLVFYLMLNFIIGYQEGETTFEIFLDYFYPATSALILIPSVVVYIFLKRLRKLGTPLLLLALSNLVTFLGDMLYTYYSWNDIYGLAGVLSDIFYVFQYLLAFIAFFILW